MLSSLTKDVGVSSYSPVKRRAPQGVICPSANTIFSNNNNTLFR